MNSITRPEQQALMAQDDENFNTSNNPSLNDIIDARMSRRGMFRATFGTAGGAVLGSMGLAACGGGGDSLPAVTAPPVGLPPAAIDLGFVAVPKTLADTVTIANGYVARPIYALGDPLTATTPAYKNDGTDTDFDNRAGDHHDGMEYFGLSAAGTPDYTSNDRGLLAMNHEALTDQFLHAAGVTARPRPAAESDKEVPAHGVSIVEVSKNAGGQFSYLQASAFNRRITPLTPMEIMGVARGNARMQTKFSPMGMACRGTINNCGTGYTRWARF